MAQKKKPSRNWHVAEHLALAIAVGGWGFQYYQTKEAQHLAYAVDHISEFKKSGAELDQVTAGLYDTLAKNADADAQKLKFRDVYLKHATLAEADRELLGISETENYLAALNVLSDEVEKSKDAHGSGSRVTAFAAVIHARRRLSEKALDL